jgi:hypothetical protein
MNTIDWNWFFSSVAQSAAAIVGIFGAFIVTKILANQSAFSEKSRRSNELIASGQRLAEAAGRLPFAWYHRHTVAEEIEDLQEILEKDADQGQSPEALYDKISFSPFIARSEAVATIRNAKSAREYRLKREREAATQQMEQSRAMGLAQILPRSNQSLLRGLNPSPEFRQELLKERENMDALYTEAKHHIRVVSDFYDSVVLNPESSSVITASLLLILTLFFAGVSIHLASCLYRLTGGPSCHGRRFPISFCRLEERCYLAYHCSLRQ